MEDEEDVKGFPCAVCNKIFGAKRLLTKHTARMHPDGKIKEKPEHSALSCGICGKMFPRLSYLQRHQLTHLNIREFECPFCNENFSQKVHLVRHVGRRHPEADKSVLERHLGCTLKAKASGTEPSTSEENCSDLVQRFLCVKCGSMFTDRYDLKRHEESIHENALVCRHCNKKFFGLGELKKHEILIRSEVHVCKCGASFSTLRNLKNHENTCFRRMEFKCVEGGCREEFCQRVQLDRHWKKCHFSIRKCGECDFVAKAPLKLAAHVLKEHKAKICGFCGEADPLPDHVSTRHWKRQKHTKKSKKTRPEIKSESLDSPEELSDVSRPMSAAESMFSDDVESSGETSSPGDDFPLNLDVPSPEVTFEEMPPEIPIEEVPHVLINFIVPVPKDTSCLELGSRLPPEVAETFPELKEAKVVLTAECQGRIVSLMVPVTSTNSEEATKWIREPIYL